MENNNHPLTCVSGYWKVKNKHDDKFIDWFHNTLKINCPYVFFGNKEAIDIVKQYREDIPTYYMELNIEDFQTFDYSSKMITHDVDCPTVELNLIWNEKIYLVEKAIQENPFMSDFFCWVDAGVCVYRNKKPPSCSFPNIDKLYKLPKDKFIYSSSAKYVETSVDKNKYYHHICGTSYILHKSIISTFVNLYKTYLDKLVDTNNIWTDQLILTHIYKDHKDKFFQLSDGYGTIIPNLYDTHNTR